jgi:hypothetical protein
MESIPMLRKLSKKSVFGFGKYKGCYVGQVMQTDKRYIGFVYYNIAGLSFVDEILNEVGITDELVIEKPSTNSELFDKFESRVFYHEVKEIESRMEGGECFENNIKAFSIAKKNTRCDISRLKSKKRNKDFSYWSKSNMQAVNQGKKSRL